MSARCRPRLQIHETLTNQLNVNIVVKKADERYVRVNELYVLPPHSFQAKSYYVKAQVRLVYQATIPCPVVSNTCGSWVYNLIHVTLLAPTILRWLFAFLLVEN
jgi:hypothetical protein